ncbi:hypothetical protein IW147_003962 [Coemansia sp. RSA 720]|nr:hypothetical protein IW147_003962 [Coemansia sp. RSA 720]
MTVPSPGLARIPENPTYPATNSDSSYRPKSKRSLRQFCSEILPPDIGSKPLRPDSIKNTVECHLASTFKRHTVLRWSLVKHQYQAPSRCSIDRESSTSNGSKSTLVDSLLSSTIGCCNVRKQSLGHRTVSTLTDIASSSFARQGPEPPPTFDTGQATRDVQGHLEERFLLRRHPQFADVLEVLSCQRESIAYRRILHRGKLWCTTFHRVCDQPAGPTQASVHNNFAIPVEKATASFQTDYSPSHASYAIYEPARVMPSTFCGPPPTMAYASPSFGGPLPYAPSSHAPSSYAPSSSSYTPSFATSDSDQLRQQSQLPQHPRVFEFNRLWQISSPQPGVFPLHCRDTRGVLDPVPLTPMVLDRHQFCYRFYLSGTKMRWQARKCGRSVIELQCFVRNSVVALLLFGGYGPEDAPRPEDKRRWRKSGRSGNYALARAEPDVLPSIVILPAAFSKLVSVDAAIVESFVLFTGIEVFECFRAA